MNDLNQATNAAILNNHIKFPDQYQGFKKMLAENLQYLSEQKIKEDQQEVCFSKFSGNIEKILKPKTLEDYEEIIDNLSLENQLNLYFFACSEKKDINLQRVGTEQIQKKQEIAHNIVRGVWYSRDYPVLNFNRDGPLGFLSSNGIANFLEHIPDGSEVKRLFLRGNAFFDSPRINTERTVYTGAQWGRDREKVIEKNPECRDTITPLQFLKIEELDITNNVIPVQQLRKKVWAKTPYSEEHVFDETPNQAYYYLKSATILDIDPISQNIDVLSSLYDNLNTSNCHIRRVRTGNKEIDSQFDRRIAILAQRQGSGNYFHSLGKRLDTSSISKATSRQIVPAPSLASVQRGYEGR